MKMMQKIVIWAMSVIIYIWTNSSQELIVRLNDSPTLQRPAPTNAVSSMKPVRISIIPLSLTLFVNLLLCLMKMTLIQMSIMSENEFEKSFRAASIMAPSAKMPLELRNMIPTRRENAATIASIIQLRKLYETCFDFCRLRNVIFENATMLQPRISVVSAVASVFTT